MDNNYQSHSQGKLDPDEYLNKFIESEKSTPVSKKGFSTTAVLIIEAAVFIVFLFIDLLSSHKSTTHKIFSVLVWLAFLALIACGVLFYVRPRTLVANKQPKEEIDKVAADNKASLMSFAQDLKSSAIKKQQYRIEHKEELEHK